ncbi:MAG: NfeD family protein [Spirochaetes bacterium]|nr:NfeD family protein [Spirochaetota bacterium]
MNFIIPDYNLTYIWLAFVIIFIIIEVTTFNLTTIWFAFGSLISMIFAYARASLTVQVLAFLFVSILLVVFARPLAVKYKVGINKTNTDSLLGEIGVVTKTIKDMSTGHVKVKGQEWSADLASGETIEVGEKVEIVDIKGVKLICRRSENRG